MPGSPRAQSDGTPPIAGDCMWLEGFQLALGGANVAWLLLGSLVGLVVGVLPGLGPTFGVALMLPFTFSMEPGTALIFLCAIHAACNYGDSFSSLMLNVPGGPGTVATCWDGYPMAKKGQAGRALGIATMFTAIHVDAIDQPGYRGKQKIFEDILHDFQLQPDQVLIVGDNHDSEIAIGARLGIRTAHDGVGDRRGHVHVGGHDGGHGGGVLGDGHRGARSAAVAGDDGGLVDVGHVDGQRLAVEWPQGGAVAYVR